MLEIFGPKGVLTGTRDLSIFDRFAGLAACLFGEMFDMGLFLPPISILRWQRPSSAGLVTALPYVGGRHTLTYARIGRNVCRAVLLFC